MNLTTLNDLVWLGYFLGVAVNILMPDWHFKWKDVLSNFLIVLVAWYISEFYTPEPALTNVVGRIIYILIFCIAFSFNPLFVYRIITSVGLNIIKSRAEKEGDAIIKREAITVEKTEEIKQP